MSQRFEEVMAARSDDELVDVIRSSAEDWDPDAIAAARREIEKRGIDVDAVREPSRAEIPRIHDRAEAGPPLDGRMKIAAFALGFFMSAIGVCIAAMIKSRWKKRGEGRSGGQFLWWALAGAIFGVVFFQWIRS